MRPAGSKKALRVKINFMFAFKAIISVQPCCEIIILFFRTCGCLGSFRLIEERRFAIVTDVEAGAVGVLVLQRVSGQHRCGRSSRSHEDFLNPGLLWSRQSRTACKGCSRV
jgi:predicted Fe-S protein YdhL (DUF1289 family)